MLTVAQHPLTWRSLTLAVGLLVLVSACTPAGPRAVLKGNRLLQQGKVDEAIERLELAVKLLPQEPRAWNQLGLAYHAAQRAGDAERAYRTALAFDRDLAVARFNLGCLLLEQNRITNALPELVSFTGLQANSPIGWLKLGHAQIRAGQAPAAEQSFRNVLNLQTNSPAALNGLGLSLLQRRRYAEAWSQFVAATRQPPTYAPALLNTAILAQRYLRDTNLAVQIYHSYLALTNAAHTESVQALVAQLTAPSPELTPPPASPDTPTNTPPATAGDRTSTEVESPATNRPVTSERPVTPPPASATNRSSPTRSADPPERTPTVQTNPPPSQPETVKDTEPRRDPAQSVITERPQSVTPTRPTAAQRPAPTVETESQEASVPPPTTEKPKPPTPKPPPKPPAQVDPPAFLPTTGPRYPYFAFGQPVSGDRSEAIRLLNEGINDQRAFRTREALEAYRRAVEVDPSLFETHYNRGVAAFELDELGEAMRAYERALAVDPDSLSARFNFATTLSKSGYRLDAVAQLEHLIKTHPEETRAHLALGNLYADRFQNYEEARRCYQRVLALEPQHPNATSLRFWLEAH